MATAEFYAERAELREREKQQKINAGTKDVRAMFQNQFNPEFYEKIRKDYMNFYEPQLNKQYGTQQKNLQYALARSGQLGRGSVDIDKTADLAEQMNIKKIQLADRANQAVNQRKGQVQGNQENILLQLQASGDASGAAADAASRASQQSGSLAYDPLGQVFTDATFGLSTQADLERRGQSRYQTNLFGGPSSSSGEVVG